MEEKMIVIRDPETFCFSFDWPKYVDEKQYSRTLKIAKTNKPHKFVLNLSQRLDIRCSNKYVALQNLSIYYTCKNIRKQYKNIKLKIIAPSWNDEFDYQMFLILCQIFKTLLNTSLKKHENLMTIPHIHVFINRINNRLVLKIQNEYKLELQTPETMKLFGSTKNLIDKTKNGEKVPTIEVAEVVLVRCNLVDNQYQ